MQNTIEMQMKSTIETQKNKQQSPIPITPVILAGGYSRRMGYPKGLIDWHGTPLIAHIAKQLHMYFSYYPMVIANDKELYKNVLSSFCSGIFADIHPQQGPLSGLEAALTYATEDYIYVSACDTPFFSPMAVQLLIDALIQQAPSSPQAIIPTTEGQAEPLCAIYHKSILPIITTCITNGQRAITNVLSQVQTVYVPCDAYQDAFININTPEDLQYALHLSSDRAD